MGWKKTWVGKHPNGGIELAPEKFWLAKKNDPGNWSHFIIDARRMCERVTKNDVFQDEFGPNMLLFLGQFLRVSCCCLSCGVF